MQDKKDSKTDDKIDSKEKTFNIYLKEVEDWQWKTNASKRKIIYDIMTQICKIMCIRFTTLLSFRDIDYQLVLENIESIKSIFINHTSIIETKFNINIIFNDEVKEKLCSHILQYLKVLLESVSYTLINRRGMLSIKCKN